MIPKSHRSIRNGGPDSPPSLPQRPTGRWCAAGARVLLDIIPGADHGAAIAPGSLRAVGYLGDRFAGIPAPSNC
ncbi:hypothetical protein [Aldersonia kunmingensis]|uniref:hypothetical protein n=1 Tax=Aldersonia kunmingensis TaxID=408066 RepID=UPI00082C2CC4|nr:hypothetical protein [Aldersonia kunmingensis]